MKSYGVLCVVCCVLCVVCCVLCGCVGVWVCVCVMQSCTLAACHTPASSCFVVVKALCPDHCCWVDAPCMTCRAGSMPCSPPLYVRCDVVSCSALFLVRDSPWIGLLARHVHMHARTHRTPHMRAGLLSVRWQLHARSRYSRPAACV